MMSNLSLDLVEEILSRVPIISLREARSTCKGWNDLTKNHSFTEKQLCKAAKGFLMIMIYDRVINLTSVNLHGIHNHEDLVDPSSKKIGNFLNQVMINKVFHCDGLLLCGTRDCKLVVWNPYLGQVRWIQPRKKFDISDYYSIGYDKSNNNYKIFRFWIGYVARTDERIVDYHIYNFKSNSWRVIDVTPDSWHIDYYQRGISLKGDTYFLSRGRLEEKKLFLVCFDFTRERFGPRLYLPFDCDVRNDTQTLSSVREEQISVLLMRRDTNVMEVWITDKIEPDAASWKKFMVVKDQPILSRVKNVSVQSGSFFIDEDKKVVVVCVRNGNIAYLIKENGYYKEMVLGESNHLPIMCSYVPSSMQIQKGPVVRACGKEKEREYI